MGMSWTLACVPSLLMLTDAVIPSPPAVSVLSYVEISAGSVAFRQH
jgi:hypothetical protein